VLLRSAVPALQFAALCMEHAALMPGNSTTSSGTSSSRATISNNVYMAALLLQPAVLTSPGMIDEWSAGGERSLRKSVNAAGTSAAVEEAALQQLTGACALLHRLMHRSAAQLQGAAAAACGSSNPSCKQ
jgi:hypothetical protein